MIGYRLAQERERLGMTKTALAEVGGVGRRTQLMYENSERHPDAKYLAAISKICIDVAYILTGVRSIQNLKPDEAALLNNYRHSSGEGKQAMQATSAALAQQEITRQSSSLKGKYQLPEK